MTIQNLAQNYYDKRGFDTSDWGRPTGRKLLEEVGELLEAIAISATKEDIYGEGAEINDIKDEVGDVAITLAYIANFNGFTVEQAIIEKTLKDTGRG